MLANFIGVLFVVSLLFVAISINKKPDYRNHHSNGKSFSLETIEKLNKLRQWNNPYNEPVGKGTGRCQYCGSTHIDSKFRPATSMIFIEKMVKRCYSCDNIIESY
jgi:hypothetical protein